METPSTKPCPGSAEAGVRLQGWIDKLLRMAYEAGEEVLRIRLAAVDNLALMHYAEEKGCLVTVEIEPPAGAVKGVTLHGLVHPITGQVVPVIGGVLTGEGCIELIFAPHE